MKPARGNPVLQNDGQFYAPGHAVEYIVSGLFSGCIRVVIACLLLLTATNLYAHSSRDIVSQRIAVYSQEYPEIAFVVLYDMKTYRRLLPLEKSLGATVRNMDYQHPLNLRATLVEAQEYRIRRMLENGMGSATLFSTPDAVFTRKPFTCVLTWFDMPLEKDPLAASRFIYNLDEQMLRAMPESRRINNMDFLMFSIDHEVFHCIDSYVNGYSFPSTSDNIEACCSRAKAELRADTFAALSHLSRHPDRKTFLINLGNARTLNLLNWDLEHYTGYMFSEVVAMDDMDPRVDIKTLVHKAMHLAEQLAPFYRGHRQFLATVWAALQTLSTDKVNVPEEYADVQGEVVKIKDVELLCNRILESHSAVHGSP